MKKTKEHCEEMEQGLKVRGNSYRKVSKWKKKHEGNIKKKDDVRTEATLRWLQEELKKGSLVTIKENEEWGTIEMKISTGEGGANGMKERKNKVKGTVGSIYW